MARPSHPNKEIEAAVCYAEQLGWRVVISKKGHAWGRIYCVGGNRGDCQMSIWSTPKNPQNHAKQIRKKVDSCPHDKATP